MKLFIELQQDSLNWMIILILNFSHISLFINNILLLFKEFYANLMILLYHKLLNKFKIFLFVFIGFETIKDRGRGGQRVSMDEPIIPFWFI